MTKQKSLASLKNKLWSLCRAITEKKYPNRCFTCDRAIQGVGRQLGHFIPSSVGGISLRYHLENLRWQCYNCNINKSGNWPSFLENLTTEIGKEKVEELLALKRQVAKADRYFYEQKIAEYEELVDNIPQPTCR